MDSEQIRNICLAMPAVTEDIKWENHLCFSVGGKMFVIVGVDHSPVTASIKVTDTNFDELTGIEGIKPAPYLARYKWIQADNINILSFEKWEKLLAESYHLVKSKLPKKVQQELSKSSPAN